MINIVSIRLRNFRAIEEAYFKPLESGITGVFGDNGAGKSSILHGALFALYGIKPPGANQNSLRRAGSKGESSVSVLFKHLGQDVEIIREIKTTAGDKNRIVVDVFVDGVRQAVGSVKDADNWVRARLGIDAAGFLTAFVVRQKELDELVNAKPAERKAIIEKLAGIDTINNALKLARENENNSKKSLATMAGSETEVNEAQATLNSFKDQESKISSDYVKAEKATNLSGKALEKLKLDSANYRNNELQINTLKTRIESSGEELVSVNKQLETYAGIDFSKSLDIELLRTKYKDLQKSIADHTEKANELTVTIGSVKSDGSRLTEQKNKLTIELQSSVKPSDTLDNLEKLSENAKSLLAEKEGLIHSNLNRKKDFTAAIETLGHSTECPTCQQDVADPQNIINTMTETVDSLSQAILNDQAEVDGLKKQIATIREEVIAAENLLRVNKELSQIEDQLAALPEIKNVEKDLTVIKSTIDELRIEFEQVSEEGKKASIIENQRSTYLELVKRKDQLSSSISSANSEMSKIIESLGGADILQIESKLAKAEKEFESFREVSEQLKVDKQLIENRISMAQEAHSTVEATWLKKKELLEKQESLVLTTDLLDKYRKNSIATLAPGLADFATSLISDMTNGDFIEIKIDDEFNPSVVDAAGQERAVSWLSGGEESAVALALRLSIAFLITGGNPQLLWLDEVLTAQDANRRSTMLSMIRGLPIDQIIMINHTQEAGDIVDKAVTVIPNLTSGSRIQDQTKEELEAAKSNKG